MGGGGGGEKAPTPRPPREGPLPGCPKKRGRGWIREYAKRGMPKVMSPPLVRTG